MAIDNSGNSTDYLRLDFTHEHLSRLNSTVDSISRQFAVVWATGSLIEAYLVTRLGLSGALPNLVGCGISTKEVNDLCARKDNIFLFLTESIAEDLGYELVACLKERYKEKIRILYLLHDNSLAVRIQGIKADAIVLAESLDSGPMAKALETVSAGETYLDPAIINAFHQSKVPRLTKREAQVLKLLEEGMSNKDIAKELLISAVTVRDYVESLMRKFNSNNRTLVVTRARQKELL